MLTRDRQFRTLIYQAKDAALFGLALWLAYVVREHLDLPIFEGHPLEDFKEFRYLYVVLLPGVPLVLDILGFYQPAVGSSRRTTAWLLFKGCALATFGLIVAMFLLKMSLARSVIVFFGIVSFILVYLSEEILRFGYRSKLAQLHLKRRVILVGTREDTERMRSDLDTREDHDIEIVAELDLNNHSINELVELMHECSPNSVVLNA